MTTASLISAELLKSGDAMKGEGAPGYFRFRRLPSGRVVISNLEGRWLVLEREEFVTFASGRALPGGDTAELFERLRERNFLRMHTDVPGAARMLQDRRGFVGAGPNLHILVVTLRCNTTCVYCHASRANMDATHTDMTPEVAERCVDRIFETTNPAITIEFQGGEPLVAFDIVKHVVEYAKKKNETEHKELEFTMVSNLSLMDEEKLAWLVDQRVQLCTSIDGPADVHDKHRKLPRVYGESGHALASQWIEKINARYREMGLDETLYHVEALVTTTRSLLDRAEELVDTYLALGCRALFLRPLDPFGFADRTAKRIEYPREDYLAYYRRAVDYMIELNKEGKEILERYAAIFLTKILHGVDPNFLDIRQPTGAGIGNLAYNYDGKVFTCDEGRMLHEMGDDTFHLGNVFDHNYRELVGHETVRANVISSQLLSQPDCTHCPYQPYCGIPPVHSHKTQGTMNGRMRESTLCQVHKGIQDYL
ncbi:MAG: His-Xaa-Ser system radical SAM maturase HxsB, partial [Myxococcota bacterium]